MSRLQQELSGELGEFWQKDAQKRIARAKEMFENEANIENGVVSWKTNGSVIMSDMVELMLAAGCNFDPEATKVAREEQVSREIAEYRANQRPPSGEELYEMRAAFGEGAEVVDIITSRKIKL